MSLILNLIAFFSSIGVFGGMAAAYFEVLDMGYIYAAFAGGSLLSVVFLALVLLITCFGNLGFVRFSFFATLAFCWSILVCSFAGYLYKEQTGGKPYLNDITTDLENPPIFKYKHPKVSLPGPLSLLSLGFNKSPRYDMANVSFQRSRYSRVKPQVFELQPEEIHLIAKKIAKKLKWKIIKEGTLSFEAVAKSRIFHLPDDVVVEVAQDSTSGAAIMRVRSRSRYGIFDFDANVNRVIDFSNQVRRLVIEQLKVQNF